MKNTIGSTYKQIRLSKGLSQDHICQTTISRTTLSRFENDKVDISIKNFHFLLAQIDMSYDEFSFILNHHQYTEKNAIIDLFFSLQSNLEISAIHRIIKQCESFLTKNQDWYIESICRIIKSFLLLGDQLPNKIDPAIQIFVSDIWARLAEQDEWYMIDFRIINYILFLFPS